MMSADFPPRVRRWRRAGSLPPAGWAAAMALALGLMLLPDRATAPMKRFTAAALAPGQTLAADGRQRLARRLELWQWQIATADEQRAAAEELAELRRRNAELAAALSLAMEKRCQEPLIAIAQEKVPDTFYSAPLLAADLVRARVLGPQARAFLASLEVLDAGSRQGLQPGSPVFAAAPRGEGESLLDQGRNAMLDIDDLVLAGRSIAGKLVDVGPQTATMQRLTEPGYRDLVQVARASGDRLRLGSKGVLEGTGEKLCRISLVEVTEPVSVGDLVVAADADGGSLPGVYGCVTRAERRPGDAHWQIWMAPAVGNAPLAEVEILRRKLNPQRVAAAAQPEAPR